MSIKTKYFQLFGVDYKTTQFSAVSGLDILKRVGDLPPYELLSLTSAVFDGEEFSLSNPRNIGLYVVDIVAELAPMVVLDNLSQAIIDYNFGFLDDWKPLTVPRRFTADIDTVQSNRTDPLIAQLIQNGSATLRDLEEYYSVEDAFAMMDVITAKGINEAMAHEAAEREAKRK